MDAAYEAFRTGTGGVVAEQRLLARDWGFAIDAVKAPVWLWHGEEDGASPVAMAHWLAGRAAEVSGAVPARVAARSSRATCCRSRSRRSPTTGTRTR